MRRYLTGSLLILVLCACGQGTSESPQPQERTTPRDVQPLGELGDHHVIYVPTYSHVAHGMERARMSQLSSTLSVHNISFRDSILIHKIRYYDTEGRLVYDFLDQKISLRPMQTHQVRAAPRDTSGLGANFLIEWEAPAGVPAPIAEAVHVSISQPAGVSFVTRGIQLLPNIVPDSFKP